ncbi:albumin-1 [Cajanus cajan]|uniref:Albumin-1 n=1 Tax=Cajanus cajan TaxID=3821 RepID=A0A151QQZ7_CAJCA|nr:albumin-1 [Cajanus cajan]XP_020208149.1 albumin-1 [Cajanus cajan]KYP32738.1 Albumin-1 [Cajanus cajan]KYP32741.1 Albumin-1 [Cajanus cajan]
MAYVRLAPLALFFLATSVIFSMKKTEAVVCSGVCSPFEVPPCGSTDCRCIPVGLFVGYCTYPSGLASVTKMIVEHPNLCQSHLECKKKGSGNFCARYPNNYMDYGWCFDSDSEAQALKGFLAMPRVIAK